jgi:hypothetical protein
VSNGSKHGHARIYPGHLLTTQTRSLHLRRRYQYFNLSIVSGHSLPHVLLAISPLAFTTQRRHGRNSGLGAAFGLPLVYAQMHCDEHFTR